MYTPTAYFSDTNIGIRFDNFSTVDIQIANFDLRRWPPARLQVTSAPNITDCHKLDFNLKYYYETEYHLISLRLRWK
jgi:hypothetical protein